MARHADLFDNQTLILKKLVNAARKSAVSDSKCARHKLSKKSLSALKKSSLNDLATQDIAVPMTPALLTLINKAALYLNTTSPDFVACAIVREVARVFGLGTLENLAAETRENLEKLWAEKPALIAGFEAQEKTPDLLDIAKDSLVIADYELARKHFAALLAQNLSDVLPDPRDNSDTDRTGRNS
jgi:hypothetical protein